MNSKTDKQILSEAEEKSLRTYFRDVHYNLVRKDLLELLSVKPKLIAKFPILLTCFAGIDFLGLLWKGPEFYNGKSKQRSVAFIKDWMGDIDSRYRTVEPLAAQLYTFIRCCLVHTASLEGDFVVTSARNFKKRHLQPTKSTQIIIQTRAFAEHYFKAATQFRRELFTNKDSAYRAYQAINKMKTNQVINLSGKVHLVGQLCVEAWPGETTAEVWYNNAPHTPKDGTSSTSFNQVESASLWKWLIEK